MRVLTEHGIHGCEVCIGCGYGSLNCKITYALGRVTLLLGVRCEICMGMEAKLSTGLAMVLVRQPILATGSDLGKVQCG